MGALLWDFTATGTGDVIEAMREVAKEAGDPALLESIVRELEDIGDILKDELDAATNDALAAATYTTRTGQLDASTYADEPVRSGDDVTVTWGARADYASYVEKRGFSQTSDIADDAVVRIDARLAAL